MMPTFVDAEAEAHFAADKMKKNNLFTTEHLFCDVYCLEPGQGQSPHAHAAADKVYYVIEGEGVIRIGDEGRKVRPGTVALACSGASHSVENPGPGRLKLLVFMAPRPS
jgi:mannose-6-phosphate isomerase-like protein (cupin superfamily)